MSRGVAEKSPSRAKTASDWDFLIFSNVEPVYVAERRLGIDLLRIGPSGCGHADGGNRLDLLDFQWKLINDQRGGYIGKRF